MLGQLRDLEGHRGVVRRGWVSGRRGYLFARPGSEEPLLELLGEPD